MQIHVATRASSSTEAEQRANTRLRGEKQETESITRDGDDSRRGAYSRGGSTAGEGRAAGDGRTAQQRDGQYVKINVATHMG